MASSTLHLIQYEGKASKKGQILATLAVSLGPLASGIGKGYSSPALASLETKNAVTDQEASWIAALSLLGALLGDVVSGAALTWGRKRLITVIALPFALVWMLTVFADHVAMICTTSFVGGFCSAIITLASQIYISEIASPGIRGTLCSLTKITTNLGMLACFVLGAYLDWRQLALVASIVPVFLFALVYSIPESPSFLMFQGYEDLALESLQWLRGKDAYVLAELEELKICVSQKHRSGERCRSVLKHSLVKPFAITCTLIFFQRFTGAFALNYYAVNIFSKTFSSYDPHSVAIMHASVQLLSSFAFGLLVDRVGRTPLLIFGNVFLSASLALLGWYLHADLHTREWIPLVCVVVFTVSYSVGIGPITLLLVSELYPLEFRGFGGAVVTSFGHACGFVVVKTFVDFQGFMSLAGTFWMYAAVSLCGVVFVYFCVPETKGRTLERIQEDLSSKTSSKV